MRDGTRENLERALKTATDTEVKRHIKQALHRLHKLQSRADRPRQESLHDQWWGHIVAGARHAAEAAGKNAKSSSGNHSPVSMPFQLKDLNSMYADVQKEIDQLEKSTADVQSSQLLQD